LRSVKAVQIPPGVVRRWLLISLVASALLTGGCGSASVDPTPENKNGVPSHAFEPDDIDRANNASQAVKDYCSGAVSEAQEVGCLSHVDESDIP
jgi:hypothetical protein